MRSKVLPVVILVFLVGGLMSSVAAAPSSEMNAGMNVGEVMQTPLEGNDKVVNIAILGGYWWTDDLWKFLDGLPPVSCTVITSDYTLETLQQYDAVIIYGNMYYGHDAIIDQYVEQGGRLIATPWAHHNYWNWDNGSPPACLPVTGTVTPIHYDHVVDMTFFNGVRFYRPTDSVGYEQGLRTKAGAFEAATWNDTYDSAAISLWRYGHGKVVYLNMHYITSDCDRAIDYSWGKALITRALIWVLA